MRSSISPRTAVLVVLLALCVCVLLCTAAPVAHAMQPPTASSDDVFELDDLASEMMAGRGLGEFADYFPEGSFYDDALHPPGASASFPPGIGPTTYSSAIELIRSNNNNGGGPANHHVPAILAALSGDDSLASASGDSHALVLSEVDDVGSDSQLELVAMSDLKSRPARQLRTFIANRDATCDGCVEKYHLVERAAELRLVPTIYDKALQQLTPLQTAISTSGTELAHLGATTPQQDAARMKEMETAEVLADPSMDCRHDNETNTLHCNRRVI